MLQTITDFNNVINSAVWGKGLYLLLATGVIMTLLTGVFQITHIGHWFAETLGSLFKKTIRLNNIAIFGVGIMIISIVGFFENIFDVSDMVLKSNEMLIVVFSIITGSVIGDYLKIESRLNNMAGLFKGKITGLIDASVFFGIGGLQICGSIMLATSGDSSQLIMKSLIDFPFALMYGMSYGKGTLFSFIPVMAGQLVIVLISTICYNFFNPSLIHQLCAIGYIILFFSGLNLVGEKKCSISPTNMIVSIFIVLLFRLWR